VNAHAQVAEQSAEGVVLALRARQVDRVQEAVGRVVEGSAERRTRPVDEDVAQRRGRAVAAVPQGGSAHRVSIASGVAV
jgi:hypothetical protein